MFHVEQLRKMEIENLKFDVVVIGAGHAGIEAAWASAELGLKVGLVTIKGVPIGSTPCNPAVGGVGKGQVVREIDALGGIMPRIADLSAIQYRVLNESKGFAVQSTRVQVDKDIYALNAEKIVSGHKNIKIVREKVQKISKTLKGEFLVETDSLLSIFAKKAIITTGTFLAGKTHIGEEQEQGGRIGCESSKGMASLFSQVQTLSTKFKTGTPPRLKKSSIDVKNLDIQDSDPKVRNFHSLHGVFERFLEQTPCYLTRTNPNTLGIIRKNKERSPIFNGQIKGVGPRYCPSIEDKAFRYPDRDSHHVFIEPEGHSASTYYPNGVSTSLPKEVQEEFIRTIPGLEAAEIEIHGYAVEYDVVDTTKLNISLEYKEIPGLYFAGQVNGTSGYEEAAGQGLIAGINAAFSIKNKEKFILDRNESYIGVMIEDLITNLRDEPYRLFTARSENRLFIREDNTINRINPYRKMLGLSKGIDLFQEKYLKEFNILQALCEKTKFYPSLTSKKHFEESNYGKIDEVIRLSDLLKRSGLNPVEVLEKELEKFGAFFLSEVIYSVAISCKYSGYIKRAEIDTERIQRLNKKTVNWESLMGSSNISNECRQRIGQIRPETFSQLKNIEGIRPATLAFVAGNIV